jgi:hypothetical protein
MAVSAGRVIMGVMPGVCVTVSVMIVSVMIVRH